VISDPRMFVGVQDKNGLGSLAAAPAPALFWQLRRPAPQPQCLEGPTKAVSYCAVNVRYTFHCSQADIHRIPLRLTYGRI